MKFTQTVESDPKLITIEVFKGDHQKGRRLFYATYPHKGYGECGRTREEALGKLLLKNCVPGYLGIEIRSV